MSKDALQAINTITTEQYPLLFEDILEFQVGETYHCHRRGSNFFTRALLKLDEENLPEHPELHGLWESDIFIKDYEYGTDTVPDIFFRCEERTRMVPEKYYERVK
jgi:hypothetical protein